MCVCVGGCVSVIVLVCMRVRTCSSTRVCVHASVRCTLRSCHEQKSATSTSLNMGIDRRIRRFMV